MKRAELRAALKPLADLERLVNRVLAGHAQPRDLVAMRDTLSRLSNIISVIGQGQVSALPKLEVANDELSLLESSIDDDPASTLQNTGIIRPGYSQELDSIIEASKH